MKKLLVIATIAALALTGCNRGASQEKKDARNADQQQSQYAIGQPVPKFNWSLERHMTSELYQVRNAKAATHSVWRSNTGMIEGDCLSIGFGIPYDTSLTNPLKRATENIQAAVIEQAEPNGIFASKNTAATWVMCAGESGDMLPIYIETKVTVYPYPVSVDYDKNRVTKAGEPSVTVSQQ